MKYDIFISYRHDGGHSTAKHLNDLLRHEGYKVSFDNDNLRNGDFDTELLYRIDACRDFIIILNETAFDRCLDPNFDPKKDWMRIELAHALKQNKNIVPVMLNGFDKFPDNLPDDIAAISRKNGPKYSEYYFDDFYNRLKNSFLLTPRYVRMRKIVLLCAAAVLALAVCYWYFGSSRTETDNAPKQEQTTTDATAQTGQTGQSATPQTTKNEMPKAEQSAKTATPAATPTKPAQSKTQTATQTPAAPAVQSPAAQPAAAPAKQPVAAQATQPVQTQQPAATPAAAPVQEVSASELVSKGVAAVRKFQPEQAVGYFKQAAAKGSVEANYHLGELYYNGNGVDKSFPTAAGYFERAANAGMADAQYMLGVMYRNGQGVTKDISTAKAWLMKAASQGHAKAEQMLNKL